MKKLRKSVIMVMIWLLIFNLFDNDILYAHKTQNTNIYSEFVPDEAREYANVNYKNALNVVLERPDIYGIDGKLEEFKLCNPYVVYNVESNVQYPLYYFPICNLQNNIVMVMAVFYTEKGWSDSICEDISDELNNADYLNKECIIYGDNDDICIENSDYKIDEQELTGTEINEYAQKSFTAKENYLRDRYETTFDIEYNNVDTEQVLIGTGLKVSTAASTLLDTDSAVVDQRINGEMRDICWAAAFATIYNYIKDRHITAKDVCNQLNHAYDGGHISDIKAAFETYNLSRYKHTKLVLEYKKIKEYLKDEKPIYMLTECGNYGHSLALVGQSKDNGKSYITAWDSNTEKYRAMNYNDGSVSYGLNGNIYHWNGSFCYK